MNHDKMKEKIQSLYDGEASESELQEIEYHLNHCPDCKQTYEHWKEISTTFFRPSTLKPSKAFTLNVMNRINQEQPIGFCERVSFVRKWLIPTLGVGAAALILCLSLILQNETPIFTESLIIGNPAENHSLAWLSGSGQSTMSEFPS